MLNKFGLSLLALIGLAIPTTSYQLYTILIGFYFIVDRNLIAKFSINLSVILFLALFTLIRFSISNYILDFNEFLRLSFFVIITAYYPNKKSFLNFSKTFKVVTFLLFIVVLLQWIFPYSDYWKELVGVFYSKNHYEAGLNKIAPRAMGFMSNIIEASFVFLGCLSLSLYHVSKDNNKIDKFFVCISVIGLLLTQSKTLIIIGLLLLLIHFITRLKSNFIYLTIIIIGLIYFGSDFLLLFSQLDRLAEEGLGVSSLQFRFNLWENIYNINIVNGSFIDFLFGVGRGVFDRKFSDLTFDSDFMYSLNQFGIIGVLILLLLMTFNLVAFFKTKNIHALSFIVLSILASFTIDVFTNVKVMFIIVTLSRYYVYENNKRV